MASDVPTMKSTTLPMADTMGEYRSISKGCRDRLALQPSNRHYNEGERCGDECFYVYFLFNIVWFLFQQFVKFCCSGWNILLYNITVPVNK